jgi:hypothetical protein
MQSRGCRSEGKEEGGRYGESGGGEGSATGLASCDETCRGIEQRHTHQGHTRRQQSDGGGISQIHSHLWIWDIPPLALLGTGSHLSTTHVSFLLSVCLFRESSLENVCIQPPITN